MQKVRKRSLVQTHRGEVVSSAGFSAVLASQQHILQLVTQTVHELQAGALETPRWQKKTEIRQLAEPALLVILKQVQHQGPGRPIGEQQSEPVTRKVQITLGEVIQAHRVIVADGDRGKGQFSRPLRVDSRVGREG